MNFLNRINSFFLLLAIPFLSIIAVVGCSSKIVSKATGVVINEKGEFQYDDEYEQQIDPPGMIFIEGGTFTMGNVQDDVMMDWDHEPTKMHIASFYIDETEVTNLMYLEYLYWLEQTFPPENQAYRDIYNGAMPDTLVWRSSLAFDEVMITNYLRHPSFAEYPVVGVSWIQANQFCKWRTNRVNEILLEKHGYIKEGNHTEIAGLGLVFDKNVYINFPKKAYGGKMDSIQGYRKGKKDTVSVFTNVADGILLPDYRLPTEAEWEYAAGNFKGTREYNNTKGRNKYPWQEKYTRNVYFKKIGTQLANFKQGKGDYGGISGWSDDGADYTNKVGSYPPNQFGLYDMAGNTSEWVSDVYRPTIDSEKADMNFFRGNKFMEPKLDENGEPIILTEVVFDTFPNGKVIATGLPGEMLMEPIKVKDTVIRTNFTRSDNTDFEDGDQASGRNYADVSAPGQTESQKSNKRMYNSPVFKIEADSIDGIKILPDKATTRTTLVSNFARVYKGGSWKDMPYWLDPAQRRFMYEYLSTNDIGFRCAMSRVGSKTKNKKNKPKDKNNFFN